MSGSSTRNEFIARRLKSEERIAQSVGADELVYMTIPSMVRAVKGPTKRIQQFCMACMDGNYPTGDVTPNVLRSIESERAAEARRHEPVPAGAHRSPPAGKSPPSPGRAVKPAKAHPKAPAAVGGWPPAALDLARRPR